MNIFVTVGTTSFDPLVEAVDKGPYAKNALIQIADGLYEPAVARWFRFEPGIQAHIDKADVVVCHGGGGSIFSLLEAGIVPLVVPNTLRRDKHQLEIARWLQRNSFAVVAMYPEQVNEVLESYEEAKQSCVAFTERRFFYQEPLNRMVRAHMGLDDLSSKDQKNSGGNNE
ncbi:PssE/Cps14G family polysaccharide biosynthesis glycosyltransferase [Granulosicoccus antarcticus]|uniref:UDP-N-acetylglucosamine--N-acetylmuramyl-(Pentapeptide) pyrophosphoryl-undecaprenol N-acetylglucosamine transferase n=1 Tax=Granulosicoccus antarcticus IMCC3135 TaxID=1192854 RepID=A0A2Z2NX23_9GAMM|nr:PssE/Cps14G family polysaccharide biosynthesis glycosyltransferase [Granulosicoccus antarcticus]ASJ74541.1 UDP-N-acetylglucosamine--N-acetylmuramyl-(pentapeptide) pyrophosphoryl-undecaprenol N-acetylglucosamine transferase [Granulosicoccus antarcticus IMCC3135]